MLFFFPKLVSSVCTKVVYILVNTHLLFSSAPFLNFLSFPPSLSLHPSISLRERSSSSLRLPFCALQLFLFWFPLPTRLSLITASSLFPHHIFSSSSSIDLFLKTFNTPWMARIQVWPLHPGRFTLRTKIMCKSDVASRSNLREDRKCLICPGSLNASFKNHRPNLFAGRRMFQTYSFILNLTLVSPLRWASCDALHNNAAQKKHRSLRSLGPIQQLLPGLMQRPPDSRFHHNNGNQLTIDVWQQMVFFLFFFLSVLTYLG